MPADLTPVQALDEIRALFDQPDLDTSITYGFANDRVRAILARVTPTEAPTDPRACSCCDTPRAKCDEWKLDPHTVACCPECNHTPSAVPGAGEVERVVAVYRDHKGEESHRACYLTLCECGEEMPNELHPAHVARAAITALRDGEVGGE